MGISVSVEHCFKRSCVTWICKITMPAIELSKTLTEENTFNENPLLINLGIKSIFVFITAGYFTFTLEGHFSKKDF